MIELPDSMDIEIGNSCDTLTSGGLKRKRERPRKIALVLADARPVVVGVVKRGHDQPRKYPRGMTNDSSYAVNRGRGRGQVEDQGNGQNSGIKRGASRPTKSKRRKTLMPLALVVPAKSLHD